MAGRPSNTYGSKKITHLPPKNAQNDFVLSFGAVIQKYRNANGMNQPQLAEIMGVTRNTVTNWENDKSRPEIDAVRKLCTLLGIPLYELFGLSCDAIPSPKENDLLSDFRQLSPVSQRIVTKVIHTMLQEETDARDAMLRDSFFLLPLHSTPAAAGVGCIDRETPPDYLFIKKNGYNERADAIVRVSGRSMEPIYHDGDLVYIKYTSAAQDGDDVVCYYTEGAVIKRVKDHKLYSLNKDYPFGEKSEQDNVKVMGRVLGIVSTDEQPNVEDIPTLEELMAVEIRKFNQRNGIE